MLPKAFRAVPFAMIAAAFSVGIGLTTWVAPHPWLMLLITVAGGLTTAHGLHRRQGPRLWAGALLTLLGLGMLRAELARPAAGPHSAARLADQFVTLNGVIVDDPAERSDHVLLRVRPTRITGGRLASDGPFDDWVLIKAPTQTLPLRWRYGDTVLVEGMLERPPRIDAFDYRLWLAQRGAFVWMPRPDVAMNTGHDPPSLFWRALFAGRDVIRQSVRANVPDPESALLNGILIGDDDLLPDDVFEAFRQTGTAHVISISGFNVGVLVGLVLLLLRRVTHPRRLAPGLIGLLWLYALFVGGSASVVRAVAMTSVSLIGLLFWRRGFTLNTLCAAIFGACVVSPDYLTDIGFQLSAAGTLGLVLFADRLSTPAERWLDQRGLPGLLRKAAGALSEAALVTVAAQLATAPLIALHFGQVSALSLAANALILPIQPPVMTLGLVGALLGALWPAAGAVLCAPAYALCAITISIVRWAADWPLATVAVRGFGVVHLTVYVLTLTAIYAGWRHRVRWAARIIPGVALVACAALISWAVFRPAPRHTLYFNGASMLLITPSGRTLLYAADGDLTGLMQRHAPFGRLDPDWRIDPLAEPQPDAPTATKFSVAPGMPGSRACLALEPGLVACPVELTPDRAGNVQQGLLLDIEGTRVLLLHGDGRVIRLPAQPLRRGCDIAAVLITPRKTASDPLLTHLLGECSNGWRIYGPRAERVTEQALSTHVKRFTLADFAEIGLALDNKRLLIIPSTIP
jgi:competence protein ComEC